jgi:hypothetical protein
MSTPANPPAFPCPPSGDFAAHSGMSLRDWIAGQALPSVIVRCSEDALINRETIEQLFARKSYRIADAMLAERVKTGGDA